MTTLPRRSRITMTDGSVCERNQYRVTCSHRGLACGVDSCVGFCAAFAAHNAPSVNPLADGEGQLRDHRDGTARRWQVVTCGERPAQISLTDDLQWAFRAHEDAAPGTRLGVTLAIGTRDSGNCPAVLRTSPFTFAQRPQYAKSQQFFVVRILVMAGQIPRMDGRGRLCVQYSGCVHRVRSVGRVGARVLTQHLQAEQVICVVFSPRKTFKAGLGETVPKMIFRSTSANGRKRGVRNPRRSERAFHSGSARCQWRDTGSISIGTATRVINTRIHSCHVDGEHPSGSARRQRYAGQFPTMSAYLVLGLPLPARREATISGECQGQLSHALSARKWSAPAQHRTVSRPESLPGRELFPRSVPCRPVVGWAGAEQPGIHRSAGDT